MKLKIGDEVQILTGKDKGKKGKITKIFRNSRKITVEKVNLLTKHIKKTAQRPGEKLRYEFPIQASNAILVCPKCKKTTRIEMKKLENKKKERICKKCKDSVDQIVTTKKSSSKQKK
ncbi:50S ribosomal protein L24 [Candidatus Peregrinibacteria bacterium]|jgi:large subunit ribosomal protein L24|nr:50S ribosomal protein L24 [Candidatus Peregrinibacteria bacterium]MBT4147764.1 50S ribosomal protein L24 [Candidatus Peregrinibacteria bacterium]MBT4365925.1 50S ribosomal protein L24 [Candidatus Peregrinibacteria bacterium]MBT4456550.1 50S ribosomal protein L24 [Candidatus Peregrinibacteria bacterium]